MREQDSLKKQDRVSIYTTIVCVCLIAAGWFVYKTVIKKDAAGDAQQFVPGNQPVDVTVATVTKGNAYPTQKYIGHIESIQKVDVCAQVDGYIEKVHFEEGGWVSEGDLLFTIQQDRYKALVELNKATLAQAQANLARSEKFITRLKNADERSVIQADIDTAESDLLQCRAQVQQAKANLELSQINLGFTEIRSPITGKIGQALITKGNYVSPATGKLAVITQMDPIRVVFSMTDREYFTLINNPEVDKETMLNARLSLPDGSLFGDHGKWAFEDNQMNPGTGTIAIRALFDNGNGRLIPQTYVTVLLENNSAKQLPMVPMQAVMTDLQGSLVFVVNNDNVAEQRRVTLGRQINGMQLVESGISEGETIVVRGVQLVHSGQKVKTPSQNAVVSSKLQEDRGV